MANIFLTKRCNLKCPYCFADEFVNKDSESISLEDFKIALEFIKTEKNERIGLIGGEPTLHPSFAKILEILASDEDIKNVVIYTNGLSIDNYIEKLKNNKFSFLVNCNSVRDIGTKNYETLKRNIKLLQENNPENLLLGINLYEENMDYSYIFELLKIVDAKRVRFSTSFPNSEKESSVDALESFKKMQATVFNFFRDCYNNNIVPLNDCNSFPECLLSTENKKTLLLLREKAKELNLKNDTLQSAQMCVPVIDILPDLTAVRCFGLSKYMKVPISDFKNVTLLREYFFNKIDLYARISFENEFCEDCKSRLLNKCGLCFTFKLKQIEVLKKIAVEKGGSINKAKNIRTTI